jgi:hypothetical protein
MPVGETERNRSVRKPLTIEVVLQAREDGGLRAWSPQLPMFILSHPDPMEVLKDVVPALETMLSARESCRMIVTGMIRREPDWVNDISVPPVTRRTYAAQIAA